MKDCLLFAIMFCLAARAQSVPVKRADLLGAWKLQRVDALRTDGTSFLPLGEQLSGTLAYLASGDVVVVWGRMDRPPAKVRSSPTDGEYRSMVQNYFNAYFGTFELDVTGTKVLHHVAGELQPGRPGLTLTRDVELQADKLTLTQPPDPCPAMLVP